jgi:hypothetical protein
MKQILFVLVFVAQMTSSGVAQERIKFPVGVSSKVLGYGHLWAAWRRGYFDREGLDVEVVLMRGTAPAVQAMNRQFNLCRIDRQRRTDRGGGARNGHCDDRQQQQTHPHAAGREEL